MAHTRDRGDSIKTHEEALLTIPPLMQHLASERHSIDAAFDEAALFTAGADTVGVIDTAKVTFANTRGEADLERSHAAESERDAWYRLDLSNSESSPIEK